ncbi:MAG: thioester domain-containing protein, partial [Oscillospiraceae bacterium]|nr:thioester domain-containing protein [Oscillospiraceae bacterium]
MKKQRILALIAAFALLLPVLAPPAAIAASPDANTFTVKLAYSDSVQMTYLSPTHPDWTTGDVPIGGAWLGDQLVIDQVYCVDAVVPFASYAKSGSDGASRQIQGAEVLDTVPNYVAVSPDKLPDAQRACWDELVWILQNGFSGVAYSALDRMNRAFPLADSSGTPLPEFGWEVAVMATKAAVWHFTNDTAVGSTSFLSLGLTDPAYRT